MAQLTESVNAVAGDEVARGALPLAAPSGGAANGRDPSRELFELREHVERTIAHSPKLREMAERAGYAPEDVASEAMARYLGKDDRDSIKDPAAWMVGAGRNFVFDLHKKGLHRETPSAPTSPAFDRGWSREQAPVDDGVDREYERELYFAAIQRLSERDQQAIAAFEHAGSVRKVEQAYGIPKSCVQRAFKRLQFVIGSENGRGRRTRARSRALAFHLGYMSSGQKEATRARLKWDAMLASELRDLQVGGRQVAALLPPGAIAAPRAHSLVERGHAVIDKLRDGAIGLVTNHGGNAEAGTGAAGLGGGAITAKVAIGLCAGAASVGGMCIGTGVVPTPAAGGDDTPAAVQTTPTDLGAATPVEPTNDKAAADAAAAAQPTLKEQKQQEFGGASAPTSSGGTREFGPAATSSSSSSSSGGSSGSGSSGGKESFGL